MLDTLWAVPAWVIVAICLGLGVLAGAVQASRGYSNAGCMGVLAIVSIVLGVSWAMQWDWRAREPILGGRTGTDGRWQRELVGSDSRYEQNRQRWVGMTDGERWGWRAMMFSAVTGPLMVGGVLTVFWMKRGRESWQRAGWE